MKYLIKIDQKSITRNPNAGRTETFVPCANTIEEHRYYPCGEYGYKYERWSFDYVELDYADGKIIRKIYGKEFLIEESFISDFTFIKNLFRNLEEMKGSPFGLMTNFRWEKDGVNYLTVLKTERQLVRSFIPEPDYLYDFSPKNIKCKNCKEKFDWSKLTEDEFENECGDIVFHDRMCPKCGTPFCCDIEYEKIDDIIEHEELTI